MKEKKKQTKIVEKTMKIVEALSLSFYFILFYLFFLYRWSLPISLFVQLSPLIAAASPKVQVESSSPVVYIYISVCVCVCVCENKSQLQLRDCCITRHPLKPRSFFFLTSLYLSDKATSC